MGGWQDFHLGEFCLHHLLAVQQLHINVKYANRKCATSVPLTQKTTWNLIIPPAPSSHYNNYWGWRNRDWGHFINLLISQQVSVSQEAEKTPSVVGHKKSLQLPTVAPSLKRKRLNSPVSIGSKCWDRFKDWLMFEEEEVVHPSCVLSWLILSFNQYQHRTQ